MSGGMAMAALPISHSEDTAAVSAARLSMREKLSYGAGEVASNLAWNMVTGFLLLYYTDVALLPVAALGTLMLVTRVADAVVDPLVGLLVDRTQSRFGKARPYLLWGAVPFGLLTVATFAVPGGGVGFRLTYAYVTFTLLGFVYALLYVPYGAMLPMLSRDPGEKTQLGSFRAMGSSLASIIAYGAVMPLVGMIGGQDRQFGFLVTAAIMGAGSAALYLLTFANTRERLSRPALGEGRKVGVSLRQMVANPIWRITIAAAILIFVKIGVMVSSFVYLAKDVLGKPAVISIALPLMSVAIMSGGFISRAYLLRFGKRRGNLCAIGLSLALFLTLPFAEGNLPLFTAIFVLSNIVGGIQATTTFVMAADAVEYQDRHFGDRAEGLLASTVSFGTKLGMALGIAATAYVLGWAGYAPGHASAGTNGALRWVFYGGQAALMLALMIVMSFYRYDSTVASAASVEKD
ncbi:MFS transporter [Novosphingobium umbonatum]|uniref:MFS transporter n=1 Tax=Novosphingobium umbonatum TaxID=1908524 RepID=A0A3S2Y2Y3_9SPHN|nr:MFS transporter [Novosphingobium umbonatum]RVU02273.1 MFS transporter [Novosphingobium umbonatum]